MSVGMLDAPRQEAENPRVRRVCGERVQMSQGRAITIRQLAENDLRLAQGIDVSEDGQSLFRYRNGQLIPEPFEWHRPAWDASQWQDKITAWADVLKWDVVIGAFDGATLVGM